MKQRLEQIKERIRKACESCSRDADSVRLVAVSKTIAAGTVKEAIEAGVTVLGENYIQEARENKVSLLCLPELSICGYGCEDAFFSAYAPHVTKSVAGNFTRDSGHRSHLRTPHYA